MKRYTVVWHPRAEDELAESWLAAPDRGYVTAAADQIDRLLANDPESQGTQISRLARELYVAPLHVMYQVLKDDRIVRIFSVIHS